MTARRKKTDLRVREQRFSLPILISTFVVLAAWTTVQMMILGQYISYEHIFKGHIIAIAPIGCLPLLRLLLWPLIKLTEI